MSFRGPKARRHLHRTSRKDTGTVCGAPHACPGAQRQRSARGCRWESSSRLGPRDAVLGIRPGGQQMTNIYYVYILSSETGVLYVGVTNDLRRRLEEHRLGA